MNPRSDVRRTGSKIHETATRNDRTMAKKPTIIVKRSTGNRPKGNGAVQNRPREEKRETDRPESLTGVVNQESDTRTEPNATEKGPVDSLSGDDLSSPVWPPMPGFDLEGANRNQQYAVRSTVVLCDCCVQDSWDGIFDVLARNFDSPNSLMWWLRKVGKAHLVDRLKGKDIVDAVRIAAHDLHRELKKEIGLPRARW